MNPLARQSGNNNSGTPPRMVVQRLQSVLRRHPWVGMLASFVSGGFLAPALLVAIEGIVSPIWVIIGTIATVLLLVLIASAYEVARIPGISATIEQLAESQVMPSYKGLVILVSSYDVATKAMDYHRAILERCWLITSSAPVMEALAERLQKEYAPLPIEIRKIRNQYEGEGTRNAITSVYASGLEDWGLQVAEVITDITGGTKAMTVGAFVACQQGNYPVQYMPSIFDATTNQRQGIGIPIRVEVQGHSASDGSHVH